MSTKELRKAAILLASLPEQQAAQLLGKLDPKQVEQVSIEIARIGSISVEEQELTIEEFANANPASMSVQTGGLALAKSLVEQALGPAAAVTLESMRQSIEALPFAFLQKIDSQNLLTFIIDEHPQTIALILCHIRPNQASEILSALPPERQLSVIRRIATMGQTSPEIIDAVQKGLEHRMASVMSHQFKNAGGVQAVAGIMNVIDRATERHLMDNLGQDDPELVDEIRRLMFVFDDISKLSSKEIQSLLKNVDNAQWAMALKGASEDLKEKIFKNMSKRGCDLLREEMQYLGAVRRANVEQMQQQIVDVVRRLQDAGEIAVHHEEGEEQFVQ